MNILNKQVLTKNSFVSVKYVAYLFHCLDDSLSVNQYISKIHTLYAKTVPTMPNALGLAHSKPKCCCIVMERMVMFILWITKRSGTEEEYSELNQLLLDISTYRRDMEEYKAKTAKEKEQKKKKDREDKKFGEEMRKRAMEKLVSSKCDTFFCVILTNISLLVFNYILLATLKLSYR